MLKNMKVGTKLLAVLVAPVLVLLVLAGIGVNQRLTRGQHGPAGRAAGPDGRRPTPTWPTSCRPRPTTPPPTWPSAGTKWGDEMDAQRAKTDQARQDYQSTVAKINPAKDSEDLKKAVGAVDDRLKNLDTQRRSVDGVETETLHDGQAVLRHLASALSDLDTAIAQATNDPTLSRGLNTFANLNRLKYTQANEAALLVAVSQIGYFPSTWPTPTRPDATPCVNPASGCDIYTTISAAASDVVQQTTIYNEAADGTQKQYYVTPPPARTWPPSRRPSSTPAPSTPPG